MSTNRVLPSCFFMRRKFCCIVKVFRQYRKLSPQCSAVQCSAVCCISPLCDNTQKLTDNALFSRYPSSAATRRLTRHRKRVRKIPTHPSSRLCSLSTSSSIPLSSFLSTCVHTTVCIVERKDCIYILSNASHEKLNSPEP